MSTHHASRDVIGEHLHIEELIALQRGCRPVHFIIIIIICALTYSVRCTYSKECTVLGKLTEHLLIRVAMVVLCIVLCWFVCCYAVYGGIVSVDCKQALSPNIDTGSSCSFTDKRMMSVKYAMAGGLAGCLSNAILYPIDTLKTMKQTNPLLDTRVGIVRHLRSIGVVKLYSGFVPACVGAIPSSALYFGAYETTKKYLHSNYQEHISRPFIHMIAAATGNVASSLVFVPKEAIKQQLQAFKTGAIQLLPGESFGAKAISRVNFVDVSRHILRTKGLKGFYPSYRATLSRNLASAMVLLRYTLV